MNQLVEEFWRLSGVGPSLLEKTSADPMLSVLAKAFSVKSVTPADVKFLLYRKVGHGVELEDKAARLGGILTSVESKEADPKTLMAFLKKHGAKPAPKVESVLESASDAVSFFQTGHKKVDSAIRWLIGKSKKKVLSDGTVNYFFHGKLPVGMVRSIVRERGVWGWTKDAGSEWGCGWERPDGEGNFAFWHGAKKSTEGKVRFTADDYRVPAAAAKKESLDEGSNQVGKTIIHQMGGGGAIAAMLGGSYTYLPNGVGIRWPNKQRSKGNYVEVVLTPADEYDMTFYNMKGTLKYWHPQNTKKQVKAYKGLMFNQLREIFYQQTGWTLSKPKIHGLPRRSVDPEKIKKAKADLRAKWKKAGLL
jgi:hypothetical protein